MRIQVFEHVPFEGPAGIAQWAAQNDHALVTTRLHAGEVPPAPKDFEMLVVMGGPMNVYEHDRYPWLAAEKVAIRSAVDAGRRVLGVCLGAQLLAGVLGSHITRGMHAEIGWFPIDFTDAAATSWPFEAFSGTRLAFHWHTDTFAIPAGCARIAGSDACENQAFASDDGQLVGLQFHWEYDERSVAAMLEHAADDLVAGPYIQTADRMLEDAARFAEVHHSLFTFLDRFATQPTASDGR